MAETRHWHFLADTYPPQNQMLRDLSIEVVTKGKAGATIQAPVAPQTCSESGCMLSLIHISEPTRPTT